MSAPRCVDCGAFVSDPRAERCGPCGQRERNRRPRTPANCADCGKQLHDGRSLRCNPCDRRARNTRRRLGDLVADDLLVCPLDGQMVKSHPRCGICTALTGAVHAQQLAGVRFNGKPICDACERMANRPPCLGAMAAVGGADG